MYTMRKQRNKEGRQKSKENEKEKDPIGMKKLNLSLFADDIVFYVENRESYGSHKKGN